MAVPAIQTFQFRRECWNTGHIITSNKTNGKNISNMQDIVADITIPKVCSFYAQTSSNDNVCKKKPSTDNIQKKNTITNSVYKKTSTDNIHKKRQSKDVTKIFHFARDSWNTVHGISVNPTQTSALNTGTLTLHIQSMLGNKTQSCDVIRDTTATIIYSRCI